MKVAAAAYPLNFLSSWAQYEDKICTWVDQAAGQGADLLVFPEYGAMELATLAGEAVVRDLEKSLFAVSDRFADADALHRRLAMEQGVHILAASGPAATETRPVNRARLFCPSGKHGVQDKQIMTRFEREQWHVQGGGPLRVFDTALGKIGILICYDVEFPELSRILADEGMDILFVPFLTDTQNGYSRVRNCAMARAIENECYVAIAGSVGNLPKVHNMDIQYAQSMVFTPCDFAFPANGVKAEATPNTEMILIADVDIDLLRQLNQLGSVRNLRDRRKDLFELNKKK